MRRLPEAEERDHDRKPDRNFSRGHGDNEEDKNLRVVIRHAAWIDVKARECDQGQVGGVQHQFEGHQNGDDVASQHHAGETNREQNTADNEVIAKCDHVSGFRVGSASPRRWLLPK